MPKNNNVVLDERTQALVEDYARTMGLDFNEALTELIQSGVGEVKKNANNTLEYFGPKGRCS